MMCDHAGIAHVAMFENITMLSSQERRMPIADKTTNLPPGTRYAHAQVDIPRSAIQAVGGRTRALTYAYNAVDRAAQNWFAEFKDFPNWEEMSITIGFTTFGVVAEISDKFAHENV